MSSPMYHVFNISGARYIKIRQVMTSGSAHECRYEYEIDIYIYLTELFDQNIRGHPQSLASYL